MFDPLSEIELRTYRVVVNHEHEDIECWGKYAIVCNDCGVYMGGADTRDRAEDEALTCPEVL